MFPCGLKIKIFFLSAPAKVFYRITTFRTIDMVNAGLIFRVRYKSASDKNVSIYKFSFSTLREAKNPIFSFKIFADYKDVRSHYRTFNR